MTESSTLFESCSEVYHTTDLPRGKKLVRRLFKFQSCYRRFTEGRSLGEDPPWDSKTVDITSDSPHDLTKKVMNKLDIYARDPNIDFTLVLLKPIDSQRPGDPEWTKAHTFYDTDRWEEVAEILGAPLGRSS